MHKRVSRLSIIGFEKPDSGKIEGFDGKTTHTGTGFKVIVVPGWHVDAPDSSVFDSGVEPDVTMSGKYHAYLMARRSWNISEYKQALF